uniref:C3H1-type domain-containing protein n=1 Tax=Magallana gigas TaxID=29159 RepID=A0A8W8HS92_MAGGI
MPKTISRPAPTERTSRRPRLHSAARDEPQTVVQAATPLALTSPVEQSEPQAPTTSVCTVLVTEPTVPTGNLPLVPLDSNHTILPLPVGSTHFSLGYYVDPSTRDKIISGSQRSQGWLTYDEQYRLRASINQNTDWGVVDPELWMIYMTPTAPQTHTYNQTYTSNKRVNSDKCFDYNFKGACTRPNCQYVHRCLRCNNAHSCNTCSSGIPTQATKVNRPFRFNTSNQGQPPTNTTTTPRPISLDTPNNNSLWSLGFTPILIKSISQYLQHYPDRQAA